jgi:hypothetical protein
MSLKYQQIIKEAAEIIKKFIINLKRRISQIDLQTRNSKIIITVLSTAIIVALLFAISWDQNRDRNGDKVEDAIAELPQSTSSPAPSEQPKATEEPAVDLPIIDLSHNRIDLDSSMLRINSPVAWGRELVYSAGNATTIDEPVLVDLYIYNIDTGAETEVAQTQIQFGEIYEGRMNQDYIVWLDTNQRGTNIIYALNRSTNETMQIKKSDYTHPQLRLYGDNLVWVEQINDKEDRLYLYNFKSGEPIVLETFNIPSYGTCPPSIYNDVVVWTYPSATDPDISIIKKLDLKQSLNTPPISPDDNLANEDDYGENSPAVGIVDDDPNRIDIEIMPSDSSESDSTADGQNDNVGDPSHYAEDMEDVDDTGVSMDTLIIDPKGFAIYPSTNGQAVAWLDNLNPSVANLKLTLDDGEEIVMVASGVGRIFGVGDSFVAYMQDEAIMLYFWKQDRYARLTAEGEAGRLSSVSGNTVIWYDANNPNQSQDKVRISIIDESEIR